MPSARLVVLASGAGTTAGALVDACADPGFGASVVAVVTDRHCGAVAVAAAGGVPSVTVTRTGTRPEFDSGVASTVAGLAPDLVVLAGWMRLLAADFVERFATVNTHPSLLPAFPGAHAVHDALAYGVRVTGATVHWVDAGLDTGPVLAQTVVPVLTGDTVDALRFRIQLAEKPQLVDVVGRLARNGWVRQGRRTTIGGEEP